jgi:hypothetical protein
MDVELRPAADPEPTAAVHAAIAAAKLEGPRLPAVYSSPWRRAGLAAGVVRRPVASGALAAQHARSDAGVVEAGDPRQDDGDEERPPGHAVAPRAGGGKPSDRDRDGL